MLKSKEFWYGFLIAYVVAIFLPPSRFLSMRGKNT